MNKTPSPLRVAVANDHTHVVWGLGKVIAAEAPVLEYVGGAHSMDALCALVREVRPDVVVLDVTLERQSTLEHMPEIIHACDAGFVVWTEHVEPSLRHRAIERGARAVVQRDGSSTGLVDLLRGLWMKESGAITG